MKTVAISYRLMARHDSERVVISKVTQNLFRQRTALLATAPSAAFLKAPDNDTITSDVLPVHRGGDRLFQS